MNVSEKDCVGELAVGGRVGVIWSERASSGWAGVQLGCTDCSVMRDMFSTAVYGVCEEQLAYDEGTTFWDYLKYFTRFWGLFSAVGM